VVAPRTATTTLSADDVLERRLKGDPRYTPAPTIPLREAGKWYVKEANSYGDLNRHYEMVHAEGYEPVTLNDLADGVTPDSIGYRLSEDGITLVRGERGQERLYKMSKVNRARLDARKTAMNNKGMGSAKAVREDIANATAATHGSEAADFVASKLHISGEDRIEGPRGS
jgi:hypothetical protein